MERVEKVERRFLYCVDGARWSPCCVLRQGEVMRGGSEVRFASGAAGEDRGGCIAGCESFCGDITLAMPLLSWLALVSSFDVGDAKLPQNVQRIIVAVLRQAG